MTSNGKVRAVARIEVTLKPGISDPQGQTVQRSLPALGWDNVSEVRIGKHLEVVLEGDSMEALHAQVDEMCRRFLTNPVLERFEFSLEPA
jgi:phosphoribosylformylglycinamidine synthase subunit PurS